MNNSTPSPKMILTAGLPGAGKSTYLREAGIDLPTVDPDEVKKSHPEYDPKDPAPLHEWSKKVARQQHLRFLSENISFVVDGTGTNVEKYVGYINEAKELGYEVELHYVKVSVQTSLERNAARERNVPNEVIMAKAGVIDQTTKVVGTVCDKFITIQND